MINQKLLKPLSFTSLVIAGIAVSQQVNAHGFMDNPKARQAICQAQGGYWWPEDGSNIPNLACRAAYLESGHVQFIQEHEFAVNTADYTNQNAIEENIPDGTLCAAGSHAKRGMNMPSVDWQRSEVVPNANDNIKIRFRATTPHNPSFWRFYLSKPDYDSASQPLTWQDLELIQTHGNIDFIKDADDKRFYEMNVAIPADRAGDAILYTHWQRIDVVGEGFFNCSDITIKRDVINPDLWQQLGFFVKQGQDAAITDVVKFRLFDETGTELVTHQLDINQQNQDGWQAELANQLNTEFGQYLQIGVKDSQGEIHFDTVSLLSNQVWATSKDHSFSLSVTAAPDNTPPIVHDLADISIDENTNVDIHVHAFDDQQSELFYTWQIPAELSYTGTDANITLTAAEVAMDTDFNISVTVSDGSLVTTKRFALTVINTTTDPTIPAWDPSKIYLAAEKVTYLNQVYVAKWWNKNQQPDQGNAWQLEVPDNDQNWYQQSVYEAGDTVIYKDQKYAARWWTQGDEPGVANVWAKQ